MVSHSFLNSGKDFSFGCDGPWSFLEARSQVRSPAKANVLILRCGTELASCKTHSLPVQDPCPKARGLLRASTSRNSHKPEKVRFLVSLRYLIKRIQPKIVYVPGLYSLTACSSASFLLPPTCCKVEVVTRPGTLASTGARIPAYAHTYMHTGVEICQYEHVHVHIPTYFYLYSHLYL